MKRPRRPAKKVARKPAPKKRKAKIKSGPYKDVSAYLAGMADRIAADAAIFDMPKPPTGFAYQWAGLGRVEYMLSKGWSRVPYSRHPELPLSTSFDGYVVYHDNALFQIASELADREKDRLQELARDLTRDFDASVGRDSPGRGFYILPPAFMVDSDYDHVAPTSPPQPVDITITFMMPARWQDAASALQLEPAEYVRRRLTIEDMLISTDKDAKFHPFELTTRKVD